MYTIQTINTTLEAVRFEKSLVIKNDNFKRLLELDRVEKLLLIDLVELLHKELNSEVQNEQA